MTAGAPAVASGCGKASSNLKARAAFERIGKKLRTHETVRILAIGSSSTQGIGASQPGFSYPAMLENDLEVLWNENVSVVNAGIGGETAAQTLARLETAIASEPFDLVIWQVGTNDAINGVAEDSFRALLERGIAAAKAAGTDIVLLDQQYFPSIKDLVRYETFVRAVGALAEERKISLFSRYALMKDWASESAESLHSMLAADGFHMGDKGYDCLADRFARDLQAAIGAPVGRPAPHATTVMSAVDY